MQTDNKLFDDLAKMFSGATGMAMDIKREIEAAAMTQVEKILARMNLVRREEFEVVREMAEKARAEQDDLKKRLSAMEGHSHPDKKAGKK